MIKNVLGSNINNTGKRVLVHRYTNMGSDIQRKKTAVLFMIAIDRLKRRNDMKENKLNESKRKK